MLLSVALYAGKVHELYYGGETGRAQRAQGGRPHHRHRWWRAPSLHIYEARDRTLHVLNEFVARAGPVHLPNEECPPESDTKAHNDCKAKVRV